MNHHYTVTLVKQHHRPVKLQVKAASLKEVLQKTRAYPTHNIKAIIRRPSNETK